MFPNLEELFFNANGREDLRFNPHYNPQGNQDAVNFSLAPKLFGRLRRLRISKRSAIKLAIPTLSINPNMLECWIPGATIGKRRIFQNVILFLSFVLFLQRCAALVLSQLQEVQFEHSLSG
jgi:hypothetical protein